MINVFHSVHATRAASGVLCALLLCLGSAGAAGADWTATGAMATARAGPGVALLPNGKVLVAGSGNGALIAELAACARRAGREVASPDEARELLGLRALATR